MADHYNYRLRNTSSTSKRRMRSYPREVAHRQQQLHLQGRALRHLDGKCNDNGTAARTFSISQRTKKSKKKMKRKRNKHFESTIKAIINHAQKKRMNYASSRKDHFFIRETNKMETFVIFYRGKSVY